MAEIANEQLVQKAKSVVRPKKISDCVCTGDVGCVLLSEGNNVYLGVSIDACCGIGFCAEHSAIAAMVTNGEYRIKKIVAVTTDDILPPCGRCREFISQIDDGNWETDVIVGENKVVKLRELLPEHWRK
jgi:cytidine deaminase